MTLLELLRQELPKRGGWPEGAAEAEVFPYEKGLVNFWTSEGKHLNDGIFNFKSNSLDLDEIETVTREQYEATGWDGTNLPPVGVECEYTKESLPGNEWTQCTVDYVGSSFVVYRDCYGVELTGIIGDIKFRPLRTEAERAIDEIIRLSGVSIGAAKILYDAGYRK